MNLIDEGALAPIRLESLPCALAFLCARRGFKTSI